MKNLEGRYLLPAVAVLALASGSAQAVTVSFGAYNAAAPGLDLSVDVTVAGGIASFGFANDSFGDSAGAVVARLYFESGLGDLGFDDPSIAGGSGVSFSTSYPGPGSPPGGNTVDWSGEYFAIGAVSPPPVNGLGVGDSLVVTFSYAGTLDALLAALIDPSGDARIAAHVLDCHGGESCAAITTTVVPAPAALALLFSALGALGLVRRRR
jgi:hypothetical protein